MAWTPSPNPGGRNRELVRTAVAEWLLAQHIRGVNEVWRTPRGPDAVDWEEVASGTTGARCVVIVRLPRVSEDRAANAGPTNPGGKIAHYEIELEIHYLGDDPSDWEGAVIDCDRIVDALKDCLRGSGRDAGRPDVILQMAEFPRENSVTDEVDDPMSIDGGIYITAAVNFTVSQYMQAQPAQ